MSEGQLLDYGVFARVGPVSRVYGLDRGGPIDRYYIDPFVRRCLQGRRGAFLEFGYPIYKPMVATADADSYDIIDIDPANAHATLVADVHRLSAETTRRFDVVICTQVLQYVDEPFRAVAELQRVLADDGLLVLTVPFMARQDPGAPSDRWRFSKRAVEELLRPFRDSDVRVAGNVFAGVCFLAGLGMDDIADRSRLDPDEPHHYIVVLASAVK